MRPQLVIRIPLNHPWSEKFWGRSPYHHLRDIEASITIDGHTETLRLVSEGAPSFGKHNTDAYVQTEWRAFPQRFPA